MSDLSLAQARAIAVSSQHLHGVASRIASIEGTLTALGCIQLDTIQMVRRSHELITLARGITASQAPSYLDHTNAPTFFEYYAHAASIIPISTWPLFAFRRRNFIANGWRGPEIDPAAVDHVRAFVAHHGPVTVTELGGAKGSGWERGSPNKWAAEWLLAIGELVCVRRRNFSRVYESAESAIPIALLAAKPSDAECVRGLTEIALRSLGVGTTDDIADYFRLPSKTVAGHLAELAEALPVRIEDWTEPAWVHVAALQPVPLDHESITPLSPFDSLIWHRPRMHRLFGVEYLLEAYKKPAHRECGYFGMPVLAGTEIIGRFALRRTGRVVRLEGHQLRDGHDPALLVEAARIAATWAGADDLTGSVPGPTSAVSVGVSP